MSKRTKWLLSIAVIAALVIGWQVAAFGVVEKSGFEDDDGNLEADPAPAETIDWNNFAPTSWTGTEPYRTDGPRDAAGDWEFFGMEDEQADRAGFKNTDTLFKSGTKQVDDCPTLRVGKAPNKDDLQRIYMSSKTLEGGENDGHLILNLAWERITLNSDQSSAHVAFEFNQNEDACTTPGDHSTPIGDLVPRSTANGGDLLIQYDFEGGADEPNISISRWIANGEQDANGNVVVCPSVQGQPLPACWSEPDTLTAGEAEAAVNQTPLPNGDELAPPGPNSTESLGNLEFGEAGIDLTAAGVFEAGDCVNFGHTSASSRSSGSSNSSNMFDIAGPGEFDLQNCGTIIINKETTPASIDKNFDYTSDIAGTQLDCDPDTTPAAFQLNTGGTSPVTTETCENVPEGTYNVTEGPVGAGFEFVDVTCEGTGTSSGARDGTTQNAIITLNGGDTVECTFENRQQQGAILVTKTRKHAASGSGDHPHAGVNFTVNGVTKATDANGQACFDGLNFATYNVVETVPAGYVGEGNSTTTVTKSVTVDNNATCSDDPFGGETVSFSNTPLTNLTVSVDSQVDGGTASTINCVDGNSSSVASGSTGTNGDGSATANNLQPGTYVCTVVIDP